MFLALLLSIALASTFFSGVNVGADTIAKQVLIRQLSQVPVDLRVSLYYPLSADNLTSIVDEVTNSGIEEITHVEVVSRLSWSAVLPDSNETYSRPAYFRITGVTENSRIYDGLTLRNGSSSLGANETYIWSGSENFEDLEIGDILHFNISMWLGPRAKTLTLNLTVVGFVDLDDQAIKIFVEHYYSINVLIADWSKTFSGIIDAYFDIGQNSEIRSQILIFLDRDSLINPWDIDGSLEGIRTIASQIGNIINLFTRGGVYVDNRLEYVLNQYRWMSQNMRLTFVITSIPVFFIAWYMGTTVSDVSYNLRRREIGLLLTKGFSRRQLLRMFLAEAILVGLVGGVIGVGLSFILTPFFIQGGGFFAVIPVMGIETIVMSIFFGVGLTLLSVFRPARRASKLDVVDALQEYRYVEEVKPYKKKWPWIAFILGSYKIVMWLLGINLLTLTMRPPPFYNILLMILLSIWIFFDTVVLNYVGSILFFWGFTKIFIRGSLKFQEFVAKLVKFAGDLIVLSTKNVRRNPARTAAIAFLIAMIIGYSFQVIGSYASEQDYNIRQVRFAVGADIGVQLNTLQNLSSTENKLSKLSDVSSTTVEYRFWHSVDERTMTFIAVSPEEWLNVAHYEGGLFTGRDVSSAFQEMENDNNTIVLERTIAETLKRNIGDEIAIGFGSKVFNLKVVGFFGPKQTQTPIYSTYGGSYWSYVPEGFYDAVKNEVYPSGKILVKLVPDADGKAVAEEIRNLKLGDVSEVYSVAEILKQLQENPFGDSGSPLIMLGIVGSTEIQRLGVAFAVLAASLGTALVTLVSLKERSKEVSVMSVRGLSFKQIVGVLLTENLAVVGFAVFLGAVVGLIVVHGNISAANSMPMSIPVPMPGPTPMYSFSPILRRMVFPPDSILTLAVCCVLVLASTIVPVIFTAKRYISELEKIVREA